MPPGVGYPEDLVTPEDERLRQMANSPVSTEAIQAGQAGPLPPGVTVDMGQGDIPAPPVPAAAKAHQMERLAQGTPAEQITEEDIQTQQALAEEPGTALIPQGQPVVPRVAAPGGGGVRRAAAAGAGLTGQYLDAQREQGEVLADAQRDLTEVAKRKADIVQTGAELQAAVRERADEKLRDQQQRRQEYYKDYQQAMDRKLELANTRLDPQEYDQAKAKANDMSLPEPERKAARAKLKNASQIDPDRVLEGIGPKIAAGIAILLGGIGSGLTGQPNQGLAVIQNAIDRDIESQRHLFAKKRQKFQDERAAGQEKLSFMEGIEADLAADKIRRLDAVKDKISAAVARLGSAEAQAAGDKAIAELTQERNKTLHDTAMKAVDQQINAESAAAQLGQGAARIQLQEAANANQRLAIGMKLAQERRDLMVPGLKGVAVNKQAQGKVMAKKAEVDSLLGEVRRLKELVFGSEGKKGAGAQALPTAVAEDAKAIASGIHVMLGKKYGLGALSGEDLDIIRTIISEDPTRWRQEVVKRQIENVLRSTNSDANAFFGAHMIDYEPTTYGTQESGYSGSYDPVFQQQGNEPAPQQAPPPAAGGMLSARRSAGMGGTGG